LTDIIALANAKNFADAVAALLAPNAEVIVHDIGSETIQYIANNFSKRDIGDPSNLKEINFVADENVIGPYEKLNFDGRRIKSISIVMRDASQMFKRIRPRSQQTCSTKIGMNKSTYSSVNGPLSKNRA